MTPESKTILDKIENAVSIAGLFFMEQEMKQLPVPPEKRSRIIARFVYEAIQHTTLIQHLEKICAEERKSQ